MTRWSKWFALTVFPEHKGAAVYKVRMTRKGHPIPIPRIGGKDKNGILFYGETKTLSTRTLNFLAAAEYNKGAHSEGFTYYFFRDLYTKRFKGRPKLEFAYQRTRNKKEAKNLEARYIGNYMQKFGEPPPLNSGIPRKAWQR